MHDALFAPARSSPPSIALRPRALRRVHRCAARRCRRRMPLRADAERSSSPEVRLRGCHKAGTRRDSAHRQTGGLIAT